MSGLAGSAKGSPALYPVIGVTGFPCSGKSLAARLLSEGKVPGLLGGRLFKADDEGHRILELPEVRERLRERFGESVIPLEGVEVDAAEVRRSIAGLVFSNPENLSWLEGIVHPFVVLETDSILAEERDRGAVIIEAALLFAADMDTRCDRILMIESDFGVRLGRAAKRGWSREELQRRERRQIPLFTAAGGRESAGRMRVVSNNGTIDDLIVELSRAIS